MGICWLVGVRWLDVGLMLKMFMLLVLWLV